MSLFRGINVLVLALALVGAGTWIYLRGVDRRHAQLVESVEYGGRMEANQRFAAAALAYEQALEEDLSDHDRSELRYRLAHAKIQGNNLAGALGVLQQMTSEDVARFHLDIGPLYLELGERAERAGQRNLARIAYREGRGVSPARYEDFARRLDAMIQPPEAPDAPGAPDSPDGNKAQKGRKN